MLNVSCHKNQRLSSKVILDVFLCFRKGLYDPLPCAFQESWWTWCLEELAKDATVSVLGTGDDSIHCVEVLATAANAQVKPFLLEFGLLLEHDHQSCYGCSEC